MKHRSRILLVTAPCVNGGKLLSYVACGLLSLQALAEVHGGEVDLLDPALAYPDRVFGSSDELASAIADVVEGPEYRAVGFSTMCSSFHHSLGAAMETKRRYPAVDVWLGGPHASVAPEMILDGFPQIDAIFVGEAESTFAEVLERRERGTAALTEHLRGVRAREGVFKEREPIADLDGLPYLDDAPAFHQSLRSARDAIGNHVPIEAERGCPGRCTFCSTRLFWGTRVRHKTARRLIGEMHRTRRVIGATEFQLYGDNLASSPEWLRSFSTRMQQEAPDFEWSCSLKLERLESADLDLLWAAGCRAIFVGVESASQATLDRMRKGLDLAHTLRLLYEAIDKGFSVDTSFIVGFPWETRADMKETYRLHAQVLKRGVRYSRLSSLCPLPGTDLEQRHGDAIRPFEGDSFASVDGLRYGENATALMARCPRLFRQLGRFETPNVDMSEARALIRAGALISSHYAEERKKEHKPSAGRVDDLAVSRPPRLPALGA